MIGRAGATMLLSVAALGAAAVPAPGQAVATADEAALTACRQAVETKQENEARAHTARAEAEYRRVLTERPEDVGARLLLARVLAECKRPHVSFLAQGRVIAQANELLEEALALESTHWAARFTLAMNHYHTPEFLGRTGDAIREFERLVEQQGGEADRPWYADTYLYLGDLWRGERRRKPGRRR